jgi:hypothetical protein
MKNRSGPRILTTVAVVTMVAAAIAFGFTMFSGMFSSDYATFGEVPIPGEKSVELPAGDVTVSFHTILIGGGGSGLPVPPLKYTITGPSGVDEVLSEDYGSTTTVNNDARVRIGYLHLAQSGTYDVRLDGNVTAYLEPKLAFGTSAGFGPVPWILAAVFAFGLLDLFVARIWASRIRRNEALGGYEPQPVGPSYVPPPTQAPNVSYLPPAPFTPSDEGIRVQTLNTLARLRDSGALTQEEYDAEKKRVLDGL